MPISIHQVKKYAGTLGCITAVFLPRLVGLGTVLTIDEPLWLSRGQTFMNALSVAHFDKTLVAGQPGVTTAWLAGIAAPWQSLAASQGAIALATGTLILIITYFFRILLGKKFGTITGLFLALDPFLLGHSRVVHTDALLALFYLASLVSLLSGLKSIPTQRRYIVMSAILAAGALVTKIFGIILIPTVLVIIGAKLWYTKERWVRILRIAGMWVSVCILTTFIIWPALWCNADKVFALLASRAALHSEGTRSEETTSSPWYYARETAFRLSIPVAILLPFAVWQFRKTKTSNHATISMYLVAAGLIFALVLNSSSDKSDRYILFSHLALVSIAPLGLKAVQKKWVWAATLVLLGYLVIDDIRLHPYYLAHYNRLYPIEQSHKLGWGEGLEQAADFLAQHHPGSKVISYYPRVFEYFYPDEVETITHIDEARGNYAVLYRSMFERGEGAAETDILHQFLDDPNKKPEHIVTINGIPYAWIFSI